MSARLCECGAITGERCVEVPASELIVIDWTPPYLRASHAAAGNSGVWPDNGDERLSVSRECLARLVGVSGAWIEEVRP